jgi:hypothetical protein
MLGTGQGTAGDLHRRIIVSPGIGQESPPMLEP